MAAKKKIIITQKINNVIYEVMPKTHADMVFTDAEYTENLSHRLSQTAELLSTHGLDIDTLRTRYNAIIQAAPENFQSFKEVYDYLQSDGDPVRAFYDLIGGKRTAEEYPTLTNEQYVDLLYTKLVELYNVNEIDNKFLELSNNINNSLADMDNRISVITSNVTALDTKIDNVSNKVDQTRTDLELQINQSSYAYVGTEPPEGDSEGSTIWYQIEIPEEAGPGDDTSSNNSDPNVDDDIGDDIGDSGSNIDDDFPAGDNSSSGSESTEPSNNTDGTDIDDGDEIIDGDDPVDDEL